MKKFIESEKIFLFCFLFDSFLLTLWHKRNVFMQKKYYIYIICVVVTVALIFLGMRKCSATESAEPEAAEAIDTLGMMLTRIQRCSRLNTAEYKVHKIITYDDKKMMSGRIFGKDVSIDLPLGKRKIAIPMYATVKASIDLTQVTDEDIVRIGEHIEVFLPMPKAEITETHIDHDGVKQYVAFTRSNFTDAELQNFESQGRAAIEKDIPNMDITEMAKRSAARQVIPIIKMLGYKEENITISFRNEEDNKIFRHNR